MNTNPIPFRRRRYNISSPSLSAYSCMCLIALSRNVHSDMADYLIYLYSESVPTVHLYRVIQGILKSTYAHAKDALKEVA